MSEEVVIEDFTTHIDHVQALRDWLQKLYYTEEFGVFFQRPIISLLITGCDYLTENLKTMRNRWRMK